MSTHDDGDVLMFHLDRRRNQVGISDMLPKQYKSISCPLDMSLWLLQP